MIIFLKSIVLFVLLSLNIAFFNIIATKLYITEPDYIPSKLNNQLFIVISIQYLILHSFQFISLALIIQDTCGQLDTQTLV